MFTLLLCVCSFGQLPRECTLDKKIFDFECCPNTTFGICGGSERGTCEDIRGRIIDPCQTAVIMLRSKNIAVCKNSYRADQELITLILGTGGQHKYLRGCVCARKIMVIIIA